MSLKTNLLGLIASLSEIFRVGHNQHADILNQVIEAHNKLVSRVEALEKELNESKIQKT